MGTVRRVAAATIAFAAVHSALASRPAKRLATRLVGRRRRNAGYRLAYNLQSVATLAALWLYARRLPDRTLYRIGGPLGWGMHAARAGAFVYGAWAAHQIGIPRMTGIAGARAWLAGRSAPPEPEAQGPALDGPGRMKATGPFAWSRHPLNLSPLPVIWLRPHMTRNFLAFSAVATLYLVVGSIHEEQRLLAAYGPAYAAYRRSGVPFYLPRPRRAASRRLSAPAPPAPPGPPG